MDEKNGLEAVLKGSGLKSTRFRAVILEILGRAGQPMSAEQVFLEMKNRKTPANLSTVYRALEAMAEKDLVTKLRMDDRMRFELRCAAHRHYMICLECRKMLTVSHCPLEEYERTLARDSGFKVVGHSLGIYGYCPNCAEKHMGRD